MVERFQNRVMFRSDERESLFLIGVCGAAILCGEHYPGHPSLTTLGFFGDAYVEDVYMLLFEIEVFLFPSPKPSGDLHAPKKRKSKNS